MVVKWTFQAESALGNIVDYIALDNVQAAISLDNFIRDKANNLSLFPNSGRKGRYAGTRELVVHTHYILVYRVHEDKVQILDVVHTSRQFPPV